MKKYIKLKAGHGLTAVMLIFTAIMLTACAGKEQAEEESGAGAAEGQKADKEQAGESIFGTFTSETLEGTEVTQDIFADADLTMVNIWGTFCGPCIREMPELGEISREYGEKGVRIVGMLCDVYEPGDETALGIVETTQADYTHIVASSDLKNGFLGQVQAVPTTVFVDSAGNQVGEVYTGSRDKESWIEIIEEMLGEIH